MKRKVMCVAHKSVATLASVSTRKAKSGVAATKLNFGKENCLRLQFLSISKNSITFLFYTRGSS